MSSRRNRRAKKAASSRKPAEEAKEQVDAVALANTLKNQGNVAFINNDFPLALEKFTEAIKLNPKDPSFFSNRSATYAARKEFTLALEDADKVVELKPDWHKGHFRRGVALENLLEYPEAIQAYRKGLELAKSSGQSDPLLEKAEKELTELLAELKMTEAQMDQGAHPDQERFERMQRWLKDGGARFPKLYLQYYGEDYRGVHCLTKVYTGDVVLYVPFKYIMTSEVARESPIGRKIIASKVELRSKHSFLASYLLVEKARGKDSFWYPYLECLPQKYANMPLFFDEPTLAHLEGSFCLQKIAERIDGLRQEYDNIRRAVPELNQFTLEEFVWARLVVITRIFGLNINGHKTDGLVPYADMLNHKRPRETKWNYEDSQKGFIIEATMDIERGAQCFDSYGRKCNSRFFVNYGFALEDNPDNECVMNVELDPNDPHFGMKMRMLNNRAIAQRRQFQVPALFPELKTKELLSFMRFANVQGSELMLISGRQDSANKLAELTPVSAENEIAALRGIRAAAEASLKKFPTTLEEDLEQLKEGVEDFNLRNCLLMRSGEKQALKWFVSLADRGIPMLQMSWRDLKREAAKCYKSSDPFDKYVTEVIVPLVKAK